jgi:hypothetical protein
LGHWWDFVVSGHGRVHRENHLLEDFVSVFILDECDLEFCDGFNGFVCSCLGYSKCFEELGIVFVTLGFSISEECFGSFVSV